MENCTKKGLKPNPNKNKYARSATNGLNMRIQSIALIVGIN